MRDPAIHPVSSVPAAVVVGDQASRLRTLVGAAERAPEPRPVRRAKIVAIASGKGGAGKTNTSVNLAIALTDLGHRVTLLDADLGMANADVLCGLAPTTRLDRALGVSDRPVAGGRRPALAEIAVEAPGGFRLIPGAVGIARMADLSQPERARLVAGLAELEGDADVVVVDTGAGVSRGVTAFVEAADLAIVVVTPEPTSVTDAYGLIKCVVGAAMSGAVTPPRLVLLVNQAASEDEARSVHARIASVAARFLSYTIPLLGWVALDPRVPAAVRRRRPLLLESPRCPASRDLRVVARTMDRELRLHAAASGTGRAAGLPGLIARLFVRGS